MLLTKICFVSAVMGIILLILISDKIESPSSEVSSIKKEDINKQVKLTGFVKKVTNRATIATLELEDKTGSIPIVLFKPENLTIKKGSLLSIDGKVAIYEDILQVYAETVKVIN